MDRQADSTFIAELLKSTNSPCFLIEARFDDGTVYMTDAWKPVTWGGHTYTAQGHFLSFDGLTETAELQVPNLTLTLSTVDQVWIAIALTKPYIDRRLIIYKAFLDYTQNIISSPMQIWAGGMDSMVISDAPQGKCAIVVTATSQWGDFERRPGRHTNPQEQSVFFPNDRFFEFCIALKSNITWGSGVSGGEPVSAAQPSVISRAPDVATTSATLVEPIDFPSNWGTIEYGA